MNETSSDYLLADYSFSFFAISEFWKLPLNWQMLRYRNGDPHYLDVPTVKG